LSYCVAVDAIVLPQSLFSFVFLVRIFEDASTEYHDDKASPSLRTMSQCLLVPKSDGLAWSQVGRLTDNYGDQHRGSFQRWVLADAGSELLQSVDIVGVARERRTCKFLYWLVRVEVPRPPVKSWLDNEFETLGLHSGQARLVFFELDGPLTADDMALASNMTVKP
jgi:hypothetical protein